MHVVTQSGGDRSTRKDRRRFGSNVLNSAAESVRVSPRVVANTDPAQPLAQKSEINVLMDHLNSSNSALGKTLTGKETETLPTAASKRPAVLLGSAAFGGTIAATRFLGAYGMDVNLLSTPLLSAAAWSARSARSFSAPAESDTDQFLKRLMEIGKANPGQILLPTSDETGWLYTAHSTELSRYFLLNQPSLEAMRCILDKHLFAEAVSKAGLTVLPTWEPQSLDHLETLAADLPYPILIKPRTHVQRIRNDKGSVVHSKPELISNYRQIVEREQYRSAANMPVLQQFVDVANEGVCSVSGYIDRTGDLFVTRRTTKVLQRSQPVGVGVCFEALPPDTALSNSVRHLCRQIGYFGMFEVEFLRSSEGWAPIDFNGRLFNQIGLDIRRKMPLPLFACLEAMGDTAGLRQAIAQAQVDDTDNESVFYDSFTLNAIMTAGGLTGRISRQERNRWREWTARHANHCVDVSRDRADWVPGLIHALSEIHLGLMAVPRFLKSMPRVTGAVSSTLVKVQP